MSLPDCETAIFSVIGASEDEWERSSLGTAVAIRSDLLITCYHVIKGADVVGLIGQNPVLEGKAVRAEVAGIDENLDLALLRRAPSPVPDSTGRTPLPFLHLENRETLDDSTPVLVWSWPEGNFSKPAHHAAVITASWTEGKNNTLQFNFAGRIEGGMSGGPVVSALNNKILGIITRDWNEDPEAILASSYLDPDSCMDDEDAQRWVELGLEKRRAAVIAQLDLGMGIALSVKELKAFLESKAPEALYPSPRPLPRGTVL